MTGVVLAPGPASPSLTNVTRFDLKRLLFLRSSRSKSTTWCIGFGRGLALCLAPHARVDQRRNRLPGSGGPVLVHAFQQIVRDRPRKPEASPCRRHDLVRQAELCGNEGRASSGRSRILSDVRMIARKRLPRAARLAGSARIAVVVFGLNRSLLSGPCRIKASRPSAWADCSAAGSRSRSRPRHHARAPPAFAAASCRRR
jgi:hypothetical protein